MGSYKRVIKTLINIRLVSGINIWDNNPFSQPTLSVSHSLTVQAACNYYVTWEDQWSVQWQETKIHIDPTTVLSTLILTDWSWTTRFDLLKFWPLTHICSRSIGLVRVASGRVGRGGRRREDSWGRRGSVSLACRIAGDTGGGGGGGGDYTYTHQSRGRKLGLWDHTEGLTESKRLEVIFNTSSKHDGRHLERRSRRGGSQSESGWVQEEAS